MEASTNAAPAEDGSRLDEFSERFNERVKQAGSELREIDHQARAFVKESPFLALGIAVASGYLLGRLLGRR